MRKLSAPGHYGRSRRYVTRGTRLCGERRLSLPFRRRVGFLDQFFQFRRIFADLRFQILEFDIGLIQ